MVGRALLWRCPWCGGKRAWFTGWFARVPRCRTCGISWQRRTVGFELGAVTVNTIVTFGLITLVLAVGFVATSPDPAVVPVLVVAGLVALVVPVAIYPITHTLWAVFDFVTRPPTAADIDAPRDTSVR
jgi:uncharacterized protein (DUF983 family)